MAAVPKPSAPRPKSWRRVRFNSCSRYELTLSFMPGHVFSVRGLIKQDRDIASQDGNGQL